jgi:hypothetical protein
VIAVENLFELIWRKKFAAQSMPAFSVGTPKFSLIISFIFCAYFLMAKHCDYVKNFVTLM